MIIKAKTRHRKIISLYLPKDVPWLKSMINKSKYNNFGNFTTLSINFNYFKHKDYIYCAFKSQIEYSWKTEL